MLWQHGTKGERRTLMSMDRYLERTLTGDQGKLICHTCNRLAPVLVAVGKIFACERCARSFEEDDGT